MQQRALGALRKAGSSFNAFSTPQKLIATIGVLALLLGGTAFYRWASAPTLQPLFTNLASSDASAIVDQLDSQGVSYQLADGGGTVLVPRDQVYKLRLSMSSAGLPSSKDTGYSLLDQQGVTASQFQQQVTYQRALEGELAKTVNALDGVDSSVVHLAIPAKDVFSSSKDKPTASVLVTMKPGKSIPAEQVQSIVHLVSSSVQNLDAKDVTVVDGKGALLSAAGTGATGNGMRDQQTTEYESRVTASLQSLLDRVVGPGNAVATVAADLSYDAVDRTSETYNAPKNTPPLQQTTTSETYKGNGSGASGVLGPDNIAVPSGSGVGINNGSSTGTSSNAGTSGTGKNGSNSTPPNSYEKKAADQTNAVNKVTEHTTQAPGTMNRQSVSVIINSSTAGNVDMTALKDAITAAAGVNTARGDSISVTRLPFDASAANAATEAAAAAKAQAKQDQLMQIGRTTGWILAALILVIGALVMSRRRRVDTVPDLMLEAAPHELDWSPDEDGGAAALEGSDELPSLPAQRTSDASTRREEVTRLVENQPDEVAELLRSWLADRRT